MEPPRKYGVLITGCSSGIGRALAAEFARRGHRVAATSRRVDAVHDLPDMAMRLPLDVTRNDSIVAAVQAAEAGLGGIDVLVNNAGYGLIGPLAEIDISRLRDQLETNVIGPLALAQAVVPAMIARSGGRILNIGSVSGVTTTPFSGAYCASKAAINALDEALRMELAPFGISVTSVQPGAVESSFGTTAARGLDRYRSSGSAYTRVADFIEARAGASQRGAMAATDFARVVAKAVLSDRPPALLRLGKWSTILPLIGRLPLRVREGYLARKFGLQSLGSR